MMITLFCMHCQVPYSPPVKSTGLGYLVVEGFINGNGATTIQLSRTRTLADTSSPISVTGAKLSVEDDHNDVYPLYEVNSGNYTIGSLDLNPAYFYRLHIMTPDGNEYTSDFVPVKNSPPIDSVNWNFKNGGVQIYANTHNTKDNVGYYRWQYSETWEIRSEYYSYYKYNKDSNKVVYRDQPVYQCWHTVNSGNIILGSTANLKNDIIYDQPINYIDNHDQRISVLYSIEVTQFALDTAGYNYWMALKKNTEELGSIFDPQPSNVTGNIHCTNDPSKVALGYIGAGTSSKTRIFINNYQMPADWNPYQFCSFTTVKDIPDTIKLYFLNMGYTPINKGIGNYTAALSPCVDCTLFGTTTKPDFWP